MRALYEIDNEILDCVDMETGEILDTEKLDALQMERERKLEGVALWIKDLAYEAEAVKHEADRLNDRKKSLDKRIADLKSWLLAALGGEKLRTPRCNVYQTHSTRLKVIDEQSVVNYLETSVLEPEMYLRFTLPEIRKDAVKDAMKRGELKEVPGCCLDVSESVVIK